LKDCGVVLDLRNQTPYTCQSLPLTAKNGATFLRIVLKGGFDILPDGQLLLAQEQPEVVMEDTYWGEPGKSSVRYESDVILGKPTTDLVVIGHARAPGDRPVEQMDVQVAYENRLIKRLRVFGDRQWWNARITRPAPFSAMPIIYDRAFGGSDEQGSEPRNRAGIGYSSAGSHTDDGMPVPNIEFPDQLIGNEDDRPAPAGLGVISKHWQPRLAYAGTYDEAWLEDQFPLLPADFDERFFQSVAPDQWIKHPQGGEAVAIQGMTPEGVLHFRLPPCEIALHLRYRDGFEDKQMVPETLLIEPDERRLVITWGASADIHGDPFRLLQMRVGEGGAAAMPGCGCGC
jgi:hypothetical protein